MHKTEVVFSFVIKTSRRWAEVLQLSEKTFDFPTTFVAAQSSAILRLGFLLCGAIISIPCGLSSASKESESYSILVAQGRKASGARGRLVLAFPD
jgi:hypothetical protein